MEALRLSFPIVTVGLFVTLLLVSPATAETRTYYYDTSGYHVTWDICWDIEDQVDRSTRDAVCGLNDGHVNVGGVQGMETPDVFNLVLIGASDAAFGTQVPMYGGWSDEQTGFARDFFGTGCGTILDFGRKGEYLHVWVQAFYNTEDLSEACFAVNGAVFADFV